MHELSPTSRSASAAGKDTNVSTAPTQGIDPMTIVTTKGGVQIFYNDWRLKSVQPIVFRHGRRLSTDDCDTEILIFGGAS